MEARNILLTVPANDAMMLVIRLTTSGVLMRSGLTLDAIDDVKMAVEEAAACLIKFASCSGVHICYAPDDDELHIRLEGERCCKSEITATPGELNTIRYILESMVDRVRLSGCDSGLTTIELFKTLSANP